MVLKDDFSSGAPVSQVPAGWFNSVARFINGLIPGKNVTFYKNDDGSPTVIGLDGVMTEGTETSPSAQGGANISGDSSGESYLDQSAFASTLAAMQTTWTRGNGTGTMLTVCTGVKKNPDAATYYAHFANLYFDENGCLFKVETAQHSYRV